MEPLTPVEADRALAFVRRVIESQWENGATPAAPAGGAFDDARGAFVSVHKAGHLRGCMGWMESDLPLGSTLLRVALSAAFDDPRFPALKEGEWGQCAVEISVLGGLEPVAGPDGVDVGRHGVQLDCDGRRAVFLPQVAVEQGWTREETLAALCRKAGLPPDAWERPDCRLSVFVAQVLR